MSFPNRFPINTTSRNVLVMFRQKFWNRCGTCLIKIMTACFPWGSSVLLSIWWSGTEKARIFHQHFLVMSCLMNLCCLSRAHPILLIDLLVGELILVYLYTSCRHIFIVAKWGVGWLETCQNRLGWNMLILVRVPQIVEKIKIDEDNLFWMLSNLLSSGSAPQQASHAI